MIELKFCKDCRYYRTDPQRSPGHFCTVPEYDVVHGLGQARWVECRMMRSESGDCCPDGKFWEYSN